MKKLLLLAVLVLAFSATAYSQDVKLDFRASGFIDFRTEWWRWNLSNQVSGRTGIIDVVGAQSKPNGGEWNKTAAYVESRLRLKFDAVMGKELSGTIFFEADTATYGDYRGGENPNTAAKKQLWMVGRRPGRTGNQEHLF